MDKNLYTITWASMGYLMDAYADTLMSAVNVCEAVSRMDCDVMLKNTETGAQRRYRKGLIMWTDNNV